ncbi:MAG: DUF4173 domain-containing protein [Lactobacillaceae bacterium]|jgi:hypothetical protein|nr:DUF4173 domain-containing protein [Lactobacillaceae bacterium]
MMKKFLAYFGFAVIEALLLFKNTESIAYPIAVILALVGIFYTVKHFNRNSLIITGLIVMLSLSAMLIMDWTTIFIAKKLIILLLILLVVENGQALHVQNMRSELYRYLIVVKTTLLASFKALNYAQQMLTKHIKNPHIKYILLGLIISLPLGSIVVALLSSADPMFARITEGGFGWLLHGINLFNLIELPLHIIFFYMVAYGYVWNFKHQPVVTKTYQAKGSSVIAITFTAVLALIYALFSLIQIAGLVHFKAGQVNYAAFAREGFFQLLAVSTLNLLVIIISVEFFHQHKLLDILLYIISGNTFILIGSSLTRMVLYVQAYHLTWLRLFVLWFLIVLTAWLIGAIIYVRKRRGLFLKFTLLSFAGCYVIFALSNPNLQVVKYNMANHVPQKPTDMTYYQAVQIEDIFATLARQPQNIAAKRFVEQRRSWVLATPPQNLLHFNLAVYQAQHAARSLK